MFERQVLRPTFQSRMIFLGVVETYAKFEARFRQNDFAGYPLTCEVKIRFSRAFHTSRTIRHPVPTQISLVNWQRDALIFRNRGESIPMSINFNYSRKRKCFWRDRLLIVCTKCFDDLSFKIFNFCRIESNFSK